MSPPPLLLSPHHEGVEIKAGINCVHRVHLFIHWCQDRRRNKRRWGVGRRGEGRGLATVATCRGFCQRLKGQMGGVGGGRCKVGENAGRIAEGDGMIIEGGRRTEGGWLRWGWCAWGIVGGTGGINRCHDYLKPQPSTSTMRVRCHWLLLGHTFQFDYFFHLNTDNWAFEMLFKCLD